MVYDDRPRVASPALDAWFAEVDEPRLLTAAESMERLRALFRPLAALEDPAFYRQSVLALWRWARAAAEALGRLSDDERLEDALCDLEIDPWVEYLRPRPAPSQRALIRLDSTSELYRAFSAEGGLPVLPPRDDRLEAWCACFAKVAIDLKMPAGARSSDAARVISDPEGAREVVVPPETLYELEDLLIDEVQRMVHRHDERAAQDHLADRYGFTRREALALVKLARADAVRYGRSTIEEDRALMVAQLKDAKARAREALNLGDEIRVLKELARVQGLTRSEPEDIEAEFLGVVRSVSAKQDSVRLAEGTRIPEISSRSEAEETEWREVVPEALPE